VICLAVLWIGAAVALTFALRRAPVASPPLKFPLSRTASADVTSGDTEVVGADPQLVFGLGGDLGVTASTPDDLRFEFQFEPPARPSICRLLFVSKGITRKRQVKVYLNEIHVADLVPNHAQGYQQQQINLPIRFMHSGLNEVLLEHADNPPDSVPWAIAKVRVMVAPIGENDGPGPLHREARRQHELAQRLLSDDPAVAPGSRFAAWKALYHARLYLEAIDPPDDLSRTITDELRSVDAQLEQVCTATLEEAEREQDETKALKIYEVGLRAFPADKNDDEHPCRQRLLERVGRKSGADAGLPTSLPN